MSHASLHRRIGENDRLFPLGGGPTDALVMCDIDDIVNNLGKTLFFRGLVGENDPVPGADGGAGEILWRWRGILKKFHRFCVR